MEYRYLGNSGLRVPALSMGTATFGGKGDFFGAWGTTGVEQATRLVDLCLDAGIMMFDSADVYSYGAAEEILGQALRGRRDQVLISTKAAFRFGDGPNDVGSSRHNLTQAVEGSLRRLQTDHIDVFQLHGFDARTPVEETLNTLDDLVRAGKIRYVGASNYSGWQLMKSLDIADQRSLPRFVAHQAYYSLANRDYEWKLMPLGIDQGIGAIVWSPLASGRLTGKIRRGHTAPSGSRRNVRPNDGPFVDNEHLHAIVDVLGTIAAETDKTISQVALNWLLRRPTVSSLLIGARNEEQLKANIGAVGWQLDADQITRLDQVSCVTPPYPYWHQTGYAERNPAPV